MVAVDLLLYGPLAVALVLCVVCIALIVALARTHDRADYVADVLRCGHALGPEMLGMLADRLDGGRGRW